MHAVLWRCSSIQFRYWGLFTYACCSYMCEDVIPAESVWDFAFYPNRQLTAFQSHPNADLDAISFINLHFALRKCFMKGEVEDHVILSCLAVLDSDVPRFWLTFFSRIKTGSSLYHWLTKQANLTTKKLEPQEINKIVAVCVPSKMRNFKSADISEHENDSALRYLMDWLNAPGDGTALLANMLILKNGFNLMLLPI